MAMFLLHIAWLLALAVLAAGLVLWRRGTQPADGVLRVGGGILVVGAVLSALCIAYYGIRYQAQGDFGHATPMHPPMEMGRMMGRGGMMGGGMMGRGPMGGPAMGRPDAPAEEMARPPGVSESEHEEHHPEATAPR
jgi:hypothetical protein